jgi:uncharacterized protein (DUF488 family)
MTTPTTSKKPTVRRRRSSSFTVGYEGRTLPEFVEILQEAGVERVVDVRALPLSRRKGFSKTPLSQALSESGIEYVHVRVAGNPFRDQKSDIETCLALYAEHLDAHPEVVVEVERVIEGHRAALLCVEGDVHCCHRSVLMDRLLARDPKRLVKHL